MADQVKKAIYELHDEGIYPSMHAINKLLGNNHLFSRPEIKEFRKKVMIELGYDENLVH